jgi:hypothetical protein
VLQGYPVVLVHPEPLALLVVLVHPVLQAHQEAPVDLLVLPAQVRQVVQVDPVVLEAPVRPAVLAAQQCR